MIHLVKSQVNTEYLTRGINDGEGDIYGTKNTSFRLRRLPKKSPRVQYVGGGVFIVKFYNLIKRHVCDVVYVVTEHVLKRTAAGPSSHIRN